MPKTLTINCLILAAGKGERFFDVKERLKREDRASGKVLYPFRRVPMLHHVLERALETDRLLRGKKGVEISSIIIATPAGARGRMIEESIRSIERYEFLCDAKIRLIKVRGTEGNAATTYQALTKAGIESGTLLVLYADVPLVAPLDLVNMIWTQVRGKLAAVVHGVERQDPSGYGRLEADLRMRKGYPSIRQIVEQAKISKLPSKSAERERLESVKFVSAGPLVFDTASLLTVLRRGWRSLRSSARTKRAASPEWRITEAIGALADREPGVVKMYKTTDVLATTGLNRLSSLRELERSISNLEFAPDRLTRTEEDERRKAEEEIRAMFGMQEERDFSLINGKGAVISQPKDKSLGGDIYDIRVTPDRKQAHVLVGDIVGHGIPVALKALTLLTMFRSLRGESLSLRHPLSQLMHFTKINQIKGSVLYFTYSAHDDGRNGGNIAVITCGPHPPLIWLKRSGAINYLPMMKWAYSPLGLGVEEPDRFLIPEVQTLERGDVIIAYTDGVSDAGRPNNSLGERGIVSAIDTDQKELNPRLICREIIQLATRREPFGQTDDRTVVAFVIE